MKFIVNHSKHVVKQSKRQPCITTQRVKFCGISLKHIFGTFLVVLMILFRRRVIIVIISASVIWIGSIMLYML